MCLGKKAGFLLFLSFLLVVLQSCVFKGWQNSASLGIARRRYRALGLRVSPIHLILSTWGFQQGQQWQCHAVMPFANHIINLKKAALKFIYLIKPQYPGMLIWTIQNISHGRQCEQTHKCYFDWFLKLEEKCLWVPHPHQIPHIPLFGFLLDELDVALTVGLWAHQTHRNTTAKVKLWGLALRLPSRTISSPHPLRLDCYTAIENFIQKQDEAHEPECRHVCWRTEKIPIYHIFQRTHLWDTLTWHTEVTLL